MRRKGEFSKAELYRKYPHMVDIPAARIAGKAHDVFREWCKGRSIAPRQRSHVRDDEWRLIMHISDKRDADEFAIEFGGERLRRDE